MIHLWDLAGRRLVFNLPGNQGPICALAFDPTGQTFSTASGHGPIVVRNARTGVSLRSLIGHTGVVIDMAFNADGSRLASVGKDRTLRVWDTRVAKEVLALNKNGAATEIRGVAFSTDGRHVAAGMFTPTKPPAQRYEVKEWDATTGQEVLVFHGHDGVITGVVFSPDGKHLASSSLDDTVRIWDRTDPSKVQVLLQPQGLVPSLAYGGNGSQLISDAPDGKLRIWSTASAKLVRTLSRPHCTSIAVSPDGKRFAYADQMGGVEIRAIRSDEGGVILRGHTRPITGLAFKPVGNRLSSVAGTFLASPRDGSMWAVGVGELKSWDPNRNLEVAPHFQVTPGPLSCVAYTSDGLFIATGGWNLDKKCGEVKLWDAGMGKPSPVADGLTTLVTSVACSPNGRLLAFADFQGNVTVRDLATGRQQFTLSRLNLRVPIIGPWRSLLFSPDGQRLAAAGPNWSRGGGIVKFWDASTGWERSTINGHNSQPNTEGILAMAYGPDSRRLATGGGDNLVQVWDADSHRGLHTLRGHAGEVTTVAFSPDGRRLASGSRDGTVRLWDPATGQEVLTLRGFPGPVASVAFSPDGTRLAVASGKEIRIMNGSQVPAR